MHFEIYRDHKDEWRWTLYASNGRKIADSGEGYQDKDDCLQGIEVVKQASHSGVRERPSPPVPPTTPFGFSPPKA
ncbi:DUF1508 domain-containing protein [Methylobacterium sp. OT2]|nr:DUF1508 domain-containing protein [Methylobacterium sp. OT2]MBN4094635.1 DUF1508 domain-containing protein [Methylobacterium sp. OT2]SEG31143.1 Uncharacterized conserved protein YegP, UPF0339 family [Methylobacterium sp. 190mf]